MLMGGEEDVGVGAREEKAEVDDEAEDEDTVLLDGAADKDTTPERTCNFDGARGGGVECGAKRLLPLPIACVSSPS